MACPEISETTPNVKTKLKEKLHLASTTTCEKFISCIKYVNQFFSFVKLAYVRS